MQTIKFARVRSVARPWGGRYPLHRSQGFLNGALVQWRMSRPLESLGHPAAHQWGRSAYRAGACTPRV